MSDAAPAAVSPPPADRRFRTRLTVAMMIVVSAVLGAALWFAERRLDADTRRDFERDFRAQLAALETVRALRHAALAERVATLARKARLHAALEDDALDLLYPSARDELRELRPSRGGAAGDPADGLRARWYRFLDRDGRVIPGAQPADAGALDGVDETALGRSGPPRAAHHGYLQRTGPDGAAELDEVVVAPIVSVATGELLAGLAAAFAPTELGPRPSGALRPGVWSDGRLFLPALPTPARAEVARTLGPVLRDAAGDAGDFTAPVGGAPHRVFFRRLNPGSAFPPAFEVALYPLDDLAARQRALRWQFLAVGVLLVGGGWIASTLLSVRLARPVEKLASESAHDRAELAVQREARRRAERFSADASHQLKTPVTVLRAGLDELLAAENLPPATREELGALVQQTRRLTHVIEDLLLLARLDAGRLRLAGAAVDLATVFETWLDDHSALPDPFGLEIVTEFSPGLLVAGDPRYTAMVVHNLLDNARKYNRPAGRVRIAAAAEGGEVVVRIGNTGAPIPAAAQEHVFERFHRGGRGETTPGHGLGLNLARELARAHGGELRLARSADDWTEFEVRLPAAAAAPAAAEEGTGRA